MQSMSKMSKSALGVKLYIKVGVDVTHASDACLDMLGHDCIEGNEGTRSGGT
jgi:hypothetical protein